MKATAFKEEDLLNLIAMMKFSKNPIVYCLNQVEYDNVCKLAETDYCPLIIKY